MLAPTVSPSQPTDSGYWRVFVDPMPSNSTSKKVDVTIFRNIPTTVESLSTTDPFGPASATISFGGITLLDAVGVGDLNWLVPEANVDICWMSPQVDISNAPVWKGNAESYVIGNIVQYAQKYYKNILAVTSNTRPDVDTTHWQNFNPAGIPLYTWEGYFVSFEFGEEDAGSTLTVQCNGAMKQMDNYLAYPEYLVQPMSYEHAIERQFDRNRRPDSRMKNCIPFKQTAITDSNFAFLKNDQQHLYNWESYAVSNSDAINTPLTSQYFKPIDLNNGDVWSGLLTRSTGNFDTVLSNYIQNLLSSMQTSSGSISLMLDEGRQPVFKHRKRLTVPEDDTLVVDLLWPGVKISLTQDYTQKINVVYGKGKASNGDDFSNLVYDDDGKKAHFEPFASRAENYPQNSLNSFFNANVMSKETQINFYDGLNAADGAVVAQRALDVFSDPGITGQITLTTDPQLLDGTGFARQKITAGKAILVQGLFGNRNGTLFHITEHSFSNDSNTVNLTIDSKYRDQLTVQEVRKRGKDSLVVSQLLGLGKYQPSINDLLFPWSYELGAGYLPKFSQSLWTNTNKDGISVGSFPWLNLTKNYPPSKENPAGSDGSSSGAYAYIPIANTTNADKNWSAPIPIVFSAKGNINNVRFAAYKADGSLYSVPFHVSLWYLAVTPSNMPQIPSPGGPDTWFQATNNTKSTGSPLSATLTVAATTAAATVNVSLKFSNNAKSWLGQISKSLPRLKINDATLIKTYKTKEVPAYTVSTSKLTISWKIPKAEAKYKVKKSKTVSKIFALTQYSSTPAGNGLIPEGFSYGWGDHYPFFKGAWETITQEGNTRPNDNTISTNTPIIGWGNYYEQAGYYPNSGGNAQTSAYQPPTGIFVDDTVFSYDFISGRAEIKEQDTPAANQAAGIGVVTGYAMFYCDQEWDGTELVPRKEAVYFIGRLYRQPPGA